MDIEGNLERPLLKSIRTRWSTITIDALDEIIIIDFGEGKTDGFDDWIYRQSIFIIPVEGYKEETFNFLIEIIKGALSRKWGKGMELQNDIYRFAKGRFNLDEKRKGAFILES